MGNTNGGKFPRVLYNLNTVKIKSGDKYKKAMERYVDLLKKEEKSGSSKWTQKTKIKASARLKKYGITLTQMKEYVEHKWLKDLASKIAA
jgi:hypothetical protein